MLAIVACVSQLHKCRRKVGLELDNMQT